MGPEGAGLQVQDTCWLDIKQKPVAGGAGHGGAQDHPVKVGQLGARGQVVVVHAGRVPRFVASAPAAAHICGWRVVMPSPPAVAPRPGRHHR